ncbi:DUF4377 domain-containing protein [Maribacter sp. 2308TA10-17]|uniref:DUF4377 domain-containing protein n=1 Tax=Maribacter sp. 2308TA10-17 TaxID=3386276 RepID=UPI0039BD3A8C
MKNSILLCLFTCIFFISCSDNNDSAIEEVLLRINSYTVDCEGVQSGKCLLIQEGDTIGTDDWEYFYFEDSIEGFSFESGFVYEITVRKTSIKNPPVDGSSIQYSLVRIISKTEV